MITGGAAIVNLLTPLSGYAGDVSMRLEILYTGSRSASTPPTLAFSVFIVAALVLLVFGPKIGEVVASWFVRRRVVAALARRP